MREFKLSAFPSDFQFMCTIVQLLDFDWPANILARLNFRAQENGLLAQARLGTRLPFSNTAGQIFKSKLSCLWRMYHSATVWGKPNSFSMLLQMGCAYEIQQQCRVNHFCSTNFHELDACTIPDYTGASSGSLTPIMIIVTRTKLHITK